MYLTEVLTRSRSGAISHRCTLLRESYREDGKVKNRTVANLTHCSPEEIAAIRFALENKHNELRLRVARTDRNLPACRDVKPPHKSGLN